jgi:unsaturated rhamnogalacturonyl hydrolase
MKETRQMSDPIDSPTSDPIVARLARGTIDIGYREWNWGEGVAQYGLVRTAQLLGSERCLDEVRQFVHANKDFRPHRPEQIMPALASLLYYEMTGDQLGLDLTTRVVDMLRTHPRSRHGAFIATPVRSAWVDYIYETVPMLYHYDRIVGSSECRQWALEQTLAYLMSCWNGHDGLFAHVYYDDVGVTTPFYWARANGWSALGLIEIAQLSHCEPGITTVLARVFKQLVDAVLACQHESGLWTTVLRDHRTYPEVSATVMISLALRQGARLGWADAAAVSAADRAWKAVEPWIQPDGRVEGVSAETPPGDADYYQEIPLGVYPWGQGFTLLAALERVYGESFDSDRLIAEGSSACAS